MIATCGHRVSEGISCSIDEFQYDSSGNKFISYGTYCDECVIAYYNEGRLDNEELSNILSKLKAQQLELEKARELITRIKPYLEANKGDEILDNDLIQKVKEFINKGKE